MERILIAGGSGLIGTRLTQILKQQGYDVAWLSRSTKLVDGVTMYFWNPDKNEIDPQALEMADYIVNLAGAGVADKPWSDERKKLIIESRTIPAEFLLSKLKTTHHKVKGYFSASAIGFYGERGDEILTEDVHAGTGFLAESTIVWENAIKKFNETSIRWAALRISVVLSKKGGALPKLLTPFLFRVGGYFGSGKQWYSWIHIDDVCKMFIHAIKTDAVRGFYNAASPQPVSNLDFTKAVGTAKGGFFIYVPGPSFIMKLAMGEMASVILNSTRVSDQKIVATGFQFQFPFIVDAIRDVLARNI